MTFSFTTLTGAGHPAIAVLAVSGANSGTIDQQTGEASDPFGSTSVSIGPITPSQNNALWVSGLNLQGPTDTPVNGNGTLVYAAGASVAEPAFGLGMAYGIQTTAASQTSSWSWDNSVTIRVVIGSFLPSTGTTGAGQGRSRAAGYAAGVVSHLAGATFGGGGGLCVSGPNTAQGFGGGSDQNG